MTISPIRAQAINSDDQHLELSRAHQYAGSLVRLLQGSLEPVFQIDLAEIQKQAIAIGDALQTIASTERSSGCCSEFNEDCNFARFYREMLDHHRLAYIAFEGLSTRLVDKLPPLRSDMAALTADIEYHLTAAETSHQASIFPAA